MVTISLCMIVKDEEAVLKRCLESAKEIADEMIVVDTGSRDQTREIAEKEGARVYQFPWIDDFAAARNFPFPKRSWITACGWMPMTFCCRRIGAGCKSSRSPWSLALTW